ERKETVNSGGEGGIRTPDRGVSPYNGLANRRLQPLGHLSDEDATLRCTHCISFPRATDGDVYDALADANRAFQAGCATCGCEGSNCACLAMYLNASARAAITMPAVHASRAAVSIVEYPSSTESTKTNR